MHEYPGYHFLTPYPLSRETTVADRPQWRTRAVRQRYRPAIAVSWKERFICAGHTCVSGECNTEMVTVISALLGFGEIFLFFKNVYVCVCTHTLVFRKKLIYPTKFKNAVCLRQV